MSREERILHDGDRFAAALEQILQDVAMASDRALEHGIREGCRVGKEEWVDGAPVNTGEYAKSIRYRVSQGPNGPVGHVYSTKPGLPHLLEFGHAKIGGGHTKAQPHVADAAKTAFEETEREVIARLGEEL